MKFSLNLAQNHGSVDLKKIPKEEILKRIGAQLGAVEDATDWSSLYENAVIVRVAECVKHPNADKLSVCRIDDGGKIAVDGRGEDGLVQVVCGAPNVHSGMYAVWLPVGATVPSTISSDPLVLEAREIRGILSNGMLASAHELAISDDRDGIIEVTEQDVGREPSAGEPLTNYFGLDDFVVDCENKMFTHRPDCFGNLGIARELSGISGMKFKSPEWYLKKPKFGTADELPLKVKNEAVELVPRFMSVAMANVTVKPSPIWLQASLTRVGIKPINNVVDITNYVMHLTGQPLHAFDYDKLKERSNKPSLKPRMSKKGEKLTLLGQKEVELAGDEVVISTDKQAVALAGVMGGADTEVDADTKSIVIEAATFDMYNIRRTSMRHGLFTDAVTRYNKGQSPLQNDRALWYAMKNISEIAGGHQASPVADVSSDNKEPSAVHVTGRYINERLGTEMTPIEIVAYLKNVEFDCDIENKPDGAVIILKPPFWRMDVKQPEDVVEEIGRLHGYDKLPVELPKRSTKPAALNELMEFKQRIRYTLKERGANELLTYSFVHGDLLRKTGIDAKSSAFHLRNAISPELQYYRPSLLPSLLSKVRANIKAQAGNQENQFALFEIGKAHIKGSQDDDKLPVQYDRLALVFAADDKTAKNFHGAAYYHAAQFLRSVIGSDLELVRLDKNTSPLTAPYRLGRSALVKSDGKELGVIGEFRPEVSAKLKLPAYCAGFELDVSLLSKASTPKPYKPLPPYPGSSQDITLEVERVAEWSKVYEVIFASASTINAEQGYLIEIEPRDIFAADDSDKKRLTFRINVTHPHKTLKTEEVTSIIDKLANAVSDEIGAARI